MIKREELKDFFLAIPMKEIDDRIVFLVELPFIHFPNYKHKKTDWGKLHICAKQLQLLFDLFNMFPKDDERPLLQTFSLSSNSQLMLIATGYTEEGGYHASPVEVGFSKSAHELLVREYPQGVTLDGCVEAIHEDYFGLSTTTKRELEREKRKLLRWRGGFTGITSMIRHGGIPHFVVPGNCACLGANPEEFNRRKEMYSHNLDSPLQQMAMLASLVTFWNGVLRPLSEKK